MVENIFYDGNDLGLTYSPRAAKFRLWAPTASRVQLVIYNEPRNSEPVKIIEMNKGRGGTWLIEIKGDYAGSYYTYRVFIDNTVNEVVDPYTRGVGTNSQRALIFDLEKTNPEGWEYDRRTTLNSYVDAIIYELHVRDFSSSPRSGINNKRKYLAFTERGTTNQAGQATGIDHLIELGITHVHLMPVFDFASVEDESIEQYNWGYDPLLYNVPEGSYATNPADQSRIIEFKKMVKALHDSGIGVIMDVVYNHTYSREESPFNLVVPDYYYRCNWDGTPSNGSGCGNEIATEKPMVRKFIIDSVKYWADEFHIDGFRFDLMALMDRETMDCIRKTLRDINPSTLIYGEPWAAAPSPLPADKQILKGAQQELNIAVFNDHFRNAIKGDNDGELRGYVSGEPHRDHAIKQGVVGSINYSHDIENFCSEPWETVNYVTSHDNLTLWDKLCKSNPGDSRKARIKMDRLAQAIILTSQGIPFITGGEEFLRTKYGNNNSYNAGDEINKLKWERKTEFLETFRYYRGLIQLRRNHPAFKMYNSDQIRSHLEFLPSENGIVSFILKDHANNDSWRDIIVIYNPGRFAVDYWVPASDTWNMVVDSKKAGVDIISSYHGNKVKVEPISACVLYR